MIFNLSPLSLGLQKESQGGLPYNHFSITILIIVILVHYFYYHPLFSVAPPHFRLAYAVMSVVLDEEKEESGSIESFLQGQSTSGN